MFRARNILWWAADRVGLLSSTDFTEITISAGHRLLHRLILTPRWYRFPFMARDDLQIGDVWTEPGARGRGLARLAVARALARAGKQRRVWYVTAADNHASIRLIESCGFILVGEGRRSPGRTGRFHLDTAR